MNVISSTLPDTGEWVSYSNQDTENIQEQHKDTGFSECPCQLEIPPTPSEHQMSSSTVFQIKGHNIIHTRHHGLCGQEEMRVGLKKLDKFVAAIVHMNLNAIIVYDYRYSYTIKTFLFILSQLNVMMAVAQKYVFCI